jgi:hypothetical protein
MTLLCDFCCHGPMVAFYPCQSFHTAGEREPADDSNFPIPEPCLDSGAEGIEGWAACDTCYKLIECDEMESLARRADSLDRDDCSKSSRIRDYRAKFRLFMDERTGPAYHDESGDAPAANVLCSED